jgi:hypothetical protein
MTNTEYDATEALAVAVAAYEHNRGYLKEKQWEPGVTKVAFWPNKELLRAYYNIDYSNAENQPPLLKVTSEHLSRAEEIRNYTKKNIFKALGYKPKTDELGISMESIPYDVQIYQKVNQEKVTVFDFGYIASAPLYFENGKKRDFAKNTVREIESKHVGSITGKVVLDDFLVIRVSKSKNFSGYVVQGVCEGNLFLYFASGDLSHLNVGDKINIEAKVKDHILENDTVPMTKLHYVRERKSDAHSFSI